MLQQKINYRIRDLGLIDYEEAYALQKRYVEEVVNADRSVILFCEHPTVLTMGRLAKKENIFFDENQLKQQKVKVIYIDRGGDVTLHAPGQLVIYLILDLKKIGKDLKVYWQTLEQVVIDLLSDFGIKGDKLAEKTGVWIGKDKIASIGIGVKRWISFHGIGLNVNTDLKLFSMIRPCGLDVYMTSMAKIKGQSIKMQEVKDKMVNHLEKIFGLEIE